MTTRDIVDCAVSLAKMAQMNQPTLAHIDRETLRRLRDELLMLEPHFSTHKDMMYWEPGPLKYNGIVFREHPAEGFHLSIR